MRTRDKTIAVLDTQLDVVMRGRTSKLNQLQHESGVKDRALIRYAEKLKNVISVNRGRGQDTIVEELAGFHHKNLPTSLFSLALTIPGT